MTRSRRRRTLGSTRNLKQSTKSRTLAQLLDATDRGALIELVRRLVALSPEAERTCFEYLREHTADAPNAKAQAAAGAAHALWSEIDPDLAGLDDFGGGDYATQDDVAERLHELEQVLRTHSIDRDDRRALLDDVLPYIQSGNAGMDDALYDVAYATCSDEKDLRNLAERFESIAQDWTIDHARRIYRQLGDRENYLRLRRHRMQYGADFHDLATFHWEQGERRQAMDTAREGLNKAEGRMDELRAFLAERAKTAGDRHGYLDLQLAQAVEHLTLASYQAFRKVCNAGEWKAYEPRVLEVLTSAWEGEQLAIRMHRGEYDRAVTILAAMKYPDGRYGPGGVLRAAAKLEQQYPEQIVAFYLSALKRTYNPTRNTYARWARAVQMARHVWIDILQTPAKWETFAKGLKSANLRRPAFQMEFAKIVPGWTEL